MCSTFLRRLTLPPLLAFLSLAYWPAHAQTIQNQKLYEKWLDEDVRWIITDQEHADFKKLSNNKQRDQFIERFWDRRNPNPGAPENDFKEEHYRRLSYVNQHFAQGVPGWKTDRGKFYVMYGKPEFILREFSTTKQRGHNEEGCFDSEEWHWRQINGIGRDVTLTFVSPCGSDEYHLTGLE
jgi:GWxTD domain-containing protein